VKGNRVVNELQ